MSRIPAFQMVSPSNARSAIAHAVLGRAAPGANPRVHAGPLGAVTLLPHQHDAVMRLRAILKSTHIALLADDVGLGKTYTALAIAREYPHARVIAPAGLLPMWRNAIARTTCHHVRLESLQRFSRVGVSAPFTSGTLVIFDEAHHLRTPTTKRYAAVSQRVTGCDVLLMSATPVHNSPRDLRALLALGLGGGAARLSRALLASVIVRRVDGAMRPRATEEPPIIIPEQPDVLNAILALPAPLPAHDGAVAGALIRLGLLRAWCSSDAALRHALRRRLLRGEALRHALAAGRHPTTAELRSWLVGEHEVQLAFPELLATHTPETEPLLELLDMHLKAVGRLLRLLQMPSAADASRAQALRDIVAKHPDQPVVAFTQFAETVRAVSRALGDIAGVGAMTGSRAWIASGPITRSEALAQFAPAAQGKPPPPAHQRIRLLLATDLLAEGVNLQDAGVVVHLDLPWTETVRQQRVGRCVRVGSPHAHVAVYQLKPHSGAAHVLQLLRRLRRKARIAARLVGAQRTGHASARRPSAADAMSRLRALLLTWADDGSRPSQSTTAPGLRLSCVPAKTFGFVVLLRSPTRTCDGIRQVVSDERLSDERLSDERDATLVLAGSLASRANGRIRVRVTDSPRRVHAALLHLRDRGDASGSESILPEPLFATHPRSLLPLVCRGVTQWLARRAFSADLHEPLAAASATHRRARSLLDQSLAHLTTGQRITSREQFQAAYRMIDGARGVGAERALMEWIGTRPQQGALEWLDAWRHSALLSAPLVATERVADGPEDWQLNTVVIFAPLA